MLEKGGVLMEQNDDHQNQSGLLAASSKQVIRNLGGLYQKKICVLVNMGGGGLR